MNKIIQKSSAPNFPQNNVSGNTFKSLFLSRKLAPSECFAVIPTEDIEKIYGDLAGIAEREDWAFHKEEFKKNQFKFPILHNYLNYTFLRILEQNRIVFSNKKACFNTGLQTHMGKDIFALFYRRPSSSNKQDWFNNARLSNKVDWNDLPQWVLNCFTDDKSKLPVEAAKAPLPASYFEGHEASNLVFDLSYEIDPNYEHIIIENMERFPEEFRRNPQDTTLLKNLCRGAIQILIDRIRRNYKIAIPHWYHGKLQLLLPLILQGNEASLALVMDKDETTKLYKIKTVLTMDMAYIDARLICRPDKDWLNP